VSQVTPARRCAFTVLRRVFEQGAYADRALQAEARSLDARERALATTLAYGAVQRRATLDYVIAELVNRPLPDLDPPVLAALRLGVFQLLFLDGVADHAAVNESVELAKRAGRGGAALVNAVLRRATREGRDLVQALDDSTPHAASLRHSVPEWLAEKWFRELGPDEARALLGHINRPAESAVRVNTLLTTRDDLLDRLPVRAHADPELPEAVILDEAFDVHGSELFSDGLLTPQSRGSMRVGHVVAPDPGRRVLDLCAAPGGKTTHLAALMGDQGEIVAVERNPRRASALRRVCERMHAQAVRVVNADAADPSPDAPYDCVLVDPPCSGLGTLQSRPDIRWRASPGAIDDLARLQRRILSAAAAATSAGGALTYSVCTISHEEGPQMIESFLDANPAFALDGKCTQLLPHRDGTEGFFIARLRRGAR
jgi:16S rRNA (cytosine967-C5)-methyltransferase